jgi:hypothetical protein
LFELLSYRTLYEANEKTGDTGGFEETGFYEGTEETEETVDIGGFEKTEDFENTGYDEVGNTKGYQMTENPAVLGILRDLSNQVGDISKRLQSVEKTQSRVLVTSEKITNLISSYPMSNSYCIFTIFYVFLTGNHVLQSTVETNVRLQHGVSTKSQGAYDLICAEFGEKGIQTTEILVALDQKLSDKDFKAKLGNALKEYYPILNTAIFRKLFHDLVFESHAIRNKIKFESYAQIMKLINGKIIILKIDYNVLNF